MELTTRNGGNWGEQFSREEFSERLDKFIWSVPKYSKDMFYSPFPYHIVKEVKKPMRCEFCGRKKLTKHLVAHHIHPLGKPVKKNCAAVCATCHEFIHYLLRKARSYPRGLKG